MLEHAHINELDFQEKTIFKHGICIMLCLHGKNSATNNVSTVTFHEHTNGNFKQTQNASDFLQI